MKILSKVVNSERDARKSPRETHREPWTLPRQHGAVCVVCLVCVLESVCVCVVCVWPPLLRCGRRPPLAMSSCLHTSSSTAVQVSISAILYALISCYFPLDESHFLLQSGVCDSSPPIFYHLPFLIPFFCGGFSSLCVVGLGPFGAED